MHKIIMRRRAALLSLSVVLLGATAAAVTVTTAGARTSAVTTSSLGQFAPTFAGTAATGCPVGCSLLSGPFNTPSTSSLASRNHPPASLRAGAALPRPHVMPAPDLRRDRAGSARHPALGADQVLPSVSCQPLGPGCDTISTSAGGATGVRGLNAVDSASLSTNINGDIEPPDQGLCAGSGFVVEANNIGEILVFNTALQRQSATIPLDTLMGLTSKGWSSGGDPACEFDPSNGGHWFFTEFVSKSSEASGGPFAGCFAAVANTCLEGIAVSDGANPFGPYHVYFLNANYNPGEPGNPFLLNDFAKISITRDAFLLFYDEFPLNGGGIGGGFFNGAQEFAFNKSALEGGVPVTLASGKPNPAFTVAIENTGLLPTPNGTCASDNMFHQPGITCWFHVIPAQPADPGQFDNSHAGSGFMQNTLDFYGSGDNRIAVWDWTGLSRLTSKGCGTCGGIRFSGQLFSGVTPYFGVGLPGAQKAGPIPLGDECRVAGLTSGHPAPKSCPEGGIATNGDGITQASQAQGQLWGSATTEVDQTFTSEPSPEVHQAAVYWVIGTGSFDTTGVFSLTNQGYVSAAHEDLEMPAMAAEGSGGNGRAIMLFTLSGNGGPTGADNGGFFPSAAYGRLTATSTGPLGSVVNIADAGLSPQDGFTEYQGLPGPTRPRWGDYSEGFFLPGSGGRIYFATEYIQFPNCTGNAFTLTIGTCGGTRDGFANWGTAVNFVVP